MSEVYKREESFVRRRFSVPKADVSVLEWLSAQSNQSASIRQVIKDFIQRHGISDITCAPVLQLPKRGRPTSRFDDDYELDCEGEHNNEEPAKPASSPIVNIKPPVNTKEIKNQAEDDDGFVDPAMFFGNN